MTLNLSPIQKIIVYSSLAGLVTLGSFGLTWFVEIPALHVERQKIDNTRATIAIDTERQKNLQLVAKQLSDLHDQQAALDKEIWKFIDEENFFAIWPALAKSSGTTIPDPIVTDATPGNAPVKRTATILATGSIANVLTVINSIQHITPLITITSVTLAPTGISSNVTATIKASTIWK